MITHYQYLFVQKIQEGLPVRLPGQDQQVGLALDFPKTTGPSYYHKQVR